MTRYRTTRLALLGLAALVLEVTVLDVFSWGGARPELMLLLACFAALFARDTKQAIVACWVLGLLKDIASAGLPGWHALLFMAVGFLLAHFRQAFYREHAFTQFALGAIGTAATGMATAVCVSITAGGIPIGVWMGRLLASALLTALIAPFGMAWLARAKFLGR